MGSGPVTDHKVRLKLRVVCVPSLAPEFSQVRGLVKKPGRWSRYWEPWLIAQWPGALEEYGHSFSHSGSWAEDFLCTSGPLEEALFCTFIDGGPLLPSPLGRRDELLGWWAWNRNWAQMGQPLLPAFLQGSWGGLWFSTPTCERVDKSTWSWGSVLGSPFAQICKLNSAPSASYQ